MSIKKKDWIPYKRKANMIEINIKDIYNQTIDFFKLHKDKTIDINKAVKRIRKNYGIDLNPSKELDISNAKKEKFTSNI